MSTSLKLLAYNGELYTEEEIDLLKYYENRRAEKQKALDQQKIVSLQLSQPLAKSQKSATTKRFSALTSNMKKATEEKMNDSDPASNIEQSISHPPTTTKRFRVEHQTDFTTMDSDNSLNKLAISDENENKDSLQTDYIKSTSDLINKSYKRKKTADHIEDDEELDTATSTSQGIESNMFLSNSLTASSNNMLLTEDWCPKVAMNADDEACSKKWRLVDFGLDRNQTLIFKLTIPTSSPRWSINITPAPRPEPDENINTIPIDDILFHFNPRKGPKMHGIVCNDRQDDSWGNVDRRSVSATVPSLFGISIELTIQ
eukprot:gene13853-29484_t